MWRRCFALAVVALPGLAFAQAGDSVVDVTIAAQHAADVAAIRDDLQDVLGRAGVVARYRDTSAIDPAQVLSSAVDAPPALARVWLDLAVASPDRAIVYLADSRWQRVLVRNVALARGLDEVARQEVSLIVGSAVDALRAGGALEVVQQGDLLLQARPVDAGARGRALSIGAGIAGGAERWSDAHDAVPAVGASLTATWGETRAAPLLWLVAAYHGATATHDALSLRVRGGTASLVGMGGWAGRRLAARVGLGPGFGLVRAEPRLEAAPPAQPVEVASPQWVPTVHLRAAARLDYRIAHRVRVFLSVVCDAELLRSRFVVERRGPGASTDPLLQPSPLQPAVMMGLEATIFGGGP